MIVIDASLAVKLVITEPDSADADRWYLGVEDEIVVPDLIAVEVAQAVVRRVNDRQLPVQDGQRILREWQAILDGGGISLLRTTPSDIGTAANLAMRLGHPVKDCVYLALAMERGSVLQTCDARFAAKAREVYRQVSLLSEQH